MTQNLSEITLPDAHQAQTNLLLIEYLQNKARAVLDPLIPVGSNVLILDYPNNSNVGDSLIWLGEIAYLESRGVNVRYVCDFNNYDANKLKDCIDKDSIILMHGGGNFGTIWPIEQEFRERVLSDFKNVKVIQMPQTIYFESIEKIKEAKKVINAHENFTILTRGIPSYELASQEFNSNVRLCPDMAFFIGPLSIDTPPVVDRFILSRTDHEKAKNWVNEILNNKKDLSVEVDDWLHASKFERILHRIEMHSSGFRHTFDAQNTKLYHLWNMLAEQRMNRGVSLLKKGKVIITDRLHVHILSILMNKPHVVIDNANKKISRFHNTWTKGYPRVKFVDTSLEAVHAATEFDYMLRNEAQP